MATCMKDTHGDMHEDIMPGDTQEDTHGDVHRASHPTMRRIRGVLGGPSTQAETNMNVISKVHNIEHIIKVVSKSGCLQLLSFFEALTFDGARRPTEFSDRLPRDPRSRGLLPMSHVT